MNKNCVNVMPLNCFFKKSLLSLIMLKEPKQGQMSKYRAIILSIIMTNESIKKILIMLKAPLDILVCCNNYQRKQKKISSSTTSSFSSSSSSLISWGRKKNCKTIYILCFHNLITHPWILCRSTYNERENFAISRFFLHSSIAVLLNIHSHRQRARRAEKAHKNCNDFK